MDVVVYSLPVTQYIAILMDIDDEANFPEVKTVCYINSMLRLCLIRQLFPVT